MNLFKSHFVYTKNQRNGILFLVIIIAVLQGIIYWMEGIQPRPSSTDSVKVEQMQRQIDSLKKVALELKQPRIYPFNPNFITDFKGYQLGMSTTQIDRLHEFRSKNLYVNSIIDFQKVTGVSDSLLNRISPYFQFPDWVREREKKTFDYDVSKEKSWISTTDINLATSRDFLTVEGVNKELSQRIVKYRAKLKGFRFKDQIYEVWGLSDQSAHLILKTFSIQFIPAISKLNINTVSFKELLAIPYIDYDLCRKIFEYKDEIAEFQSLEELKQIPGFPLDKYERIVVYLQSQ